MCEVYYKDYAERFGQELPACEYKGNKSKIQELIQKIHIDANGSVIEAKFDIETNVGAMNIS